MPADTIAAAPYHFAALVFFHYFIDHGLCRALLCYCYAAADCFDIDYAAMLMSDTRFAARLR